MKRDAAIKHMLLDCNKAVFKNQCIFLINILRVLYKEIYE